MAQSFEINDMARQVLGREATAAELSGGANLSVGQLADYLRGGGSGGGGGTAGGGNAASYDVLASSLPSTLEFIKGAEQPVSDVLNQLVMAIRGQEDPLVAYSRIEEEMGIPAQRRAAGTVREQIYSLEDAIRGVEPMIAGTTRESLVTEPQRARMVTAARKPLLENLARFTTDLGRISESIVSMERTLGTRTELYLRGQEKQLQPLQLQLSYLQDRAARLLTGFTADKQTYLDIALQKIRRGEQLSDIEREQSFELLKLEKNYQQELAMMIKQSEINIEQWKQTTGRQTPTPTPVSTEKYYDGGATVLEGGGGGGGTEDIWNEALVE